MSNPPNVRLDFYDEAIIMASWGQDGSLVSHPVCPEDVVAACTGVSLSSGLLPHNTLFWKKGADKLCLGIFVPSRRWQVHLQVEGETKQIRIPLPPHIFVGHGRSYSAYAVKRRPSAGLESLYHLPAPNVHGGGSICQGNTPFPVCDGQTIYQALKLFWEESLFNAHLVTAKATSHNRDVRQLWREINGRKRFPLGELVPLGRRVHSLL